MSVFSLFFYEKYLLDGYHSWKSFNNKDVIYTFIYCKTIYLESVITENVFPFSSVLKFVTYAYCNRFQIVNYQINNNF